MKSDDQLQRDVYEELKWDPMVNETNVKASVRDGAVVLAGHVPSYAEKLAARDAAIRVKGVVSTTDNIEVKLPFTSYRKDEEIERAISNSLKWNVWVPDRIKVAVGRGWVTLMGEVDWQFKGKEAENIVSHVIGVRGVSNFISVKQRDVKGDKTKQAIESAFDKNRRIDAEASLQK